MVPRIVAGGERAGTRQERRLGDALVARATHSAQTHALPLAAAGSWSSNAAGIDTCAHQHGPVAPAHEPSTPHATAQRFGCPHSGQRVGSGSVIAAQ